MFLFSVISGSVWSTIDHFKKEEGLAVQKWRQDMTTTSQRSPNQEDGGTKRVVTQRDKMNKLRNMVARYGDFEGAAARTEYLLLISEIIDD